MKRKIALGIFVLAALMAIFFLWPRQERLPLLGSVENAALESVDGSTFQLHDQKIKLVVFFYTHCPDICPMTLFDLEQVKKELETKNLFKEKVRFISITLDPEVDTQERLQEYAQNFSVDHAGWMMLRGDTSTTEQIAKDFKMIYQKNESGFVTHSTTMYLVDANNKIRAYHDMAVGDKKVNVEEVVQHIEWLAAE
ncbi:SCO family protein [Bacillus sp. SG-1]|uniref:SCO family protein n=1 Tax=Bacillus sp. SG-1 TaxID=161544 RepID=UPI00000B66E9|nr:SCO family protein [Bacillus sp. SG-1]AAB06485.1 MnxC [Bacillus sp. (in: firmicutes)]EDL64240.1 manganese oxidation [Bacillus sp. SG-1]